MIGYSVNEGTMTIMLKGEIDHHSAADIRRETDELIRKFMPKRLVLNFNAVTFCDSSGIAVVLGRYKLMKEFDGTVELTGMSEAVRKIFLLAKADKFVTM